MMAGKVLSVPDVAASIVGFIGKHVPSPWDCHDCDPSWSGWHCLTCCQFVPCRFHRTWNPVDHWGSCGQSCPCCRAFEAFGGCEQCEDTTVLLGTCKAGYEAVLVHAIVFGALVDAS